MVRNKHEHVADFSKFEIYKRDTLSFLENIYTVKVHIRDIPWFNFFHKLAEEDTLDFNVSSFVKEKNTEELLNNIFQAIDWELTDIENQDEEYREILEQEVNRSSGWVNYKKLNEAKKKAIETITYNLKYTILNKSMIESRLRDEIESAFMQIYSMQAEIIEEFTKLCADDMRMSEKEDKVFINQFQLYIKTAILRNIDPIFPENFNKAYLDYSFREIKLRSMFENKEYQINLALLAQMGSMGIKL